MAVKKPVGAGHKMHMYTIIVTDLFEGLRNWRRREGSPTGVGGQREGQARLERWVAKDEDQIIHWL